MIALLGRALLPIASLSLAPPGQTLDAELLRSVEELIHTEIGTQHIGWRGRCHRGAPRRAVGDGRAVYSVSLRVLRAPHGRCMMEPVTPAAADLGIACMDTPRA